MDVSSYSIERLIRLGFRYRLLSDYRMTPATIQLRCAGNLLDFDPEEARIFLCGLLTGYTRARQNPERTLTSESRPFVPASLYFT